MANVTVIIDGIATGVSAGSTVLTAARALNINISTLCDHPAIKPIGACRMCLVEIEKQRVLQPACTFPVSEGMVVHTNTPATTSARRFILQLLLSDHPFDCMTCEKAGDCTLQDLAFAYGIKKTDYEGTRHNYPILDDNPFYLRDYDKCILCRRCIRTCDEINGVAAIGLIGRGFDTRVGTAFDGAMADSPCEFCGMCVELCPVGALMPKSIIGAGRTWDTTATKTICPYCGVGCSLELHVKDNKIVYVKSDWNGQANKGWTCVKGRFGWDFVSSPERLTKPLIRKDGVMVESSWDEALDLVADRFTQIAQEADLMPWPF